MYVCIRDVKFVFSKFELCKIQILFALRLGLWYSEFVLTSTVCPQYFIQHGFRVIVMVLNFGTRSHFSFLLIACFITFCVHTALQQKQQHQCIIYSMHYRSSHPGFEYRMYANRIQIQFFKTEVRKFELC